MMDKSTEFCEVSVVLPTFNRAELLPRAIESVLLQTYSEFELIVVDDCSQDDTKEVVGSYRDARLQYVRHEQNRGGASARNTGIGCAKGKYIAFLDSDDEWRHNKLEVLIDLFNHSPDDIGMVYSAYRVIDESENVKIRYPHHRGRIHDRIGISNCIGGMSVAVLRRSALIVVGGFDESLPALQDWDLYFRISKSYKVDFSSEELVTMNFSARWARISTNYNSRTQGTIICYKKHYKALKELGVAGKWEVRIARALIGLGRVDEADQYIELASCSGMPNSERLRLRVLQAIPVHLYRIFRRLRLKSVSDPRTKHKLR